MSLKDLIEENFKQGLIEGHAGVPMEFPEGIRPLGEFKGEGQWAGLTEEAVASEVTPNMDDEVCDAEIIED